MSFHINRFRTFSKNVFNFPAIKSILNNKPYYKLYKYNQNLSKLTSYSFDKLNHIFLKKPLLKTPLYSIISKNNTKSEVQKPLQSSFLSVIMFIILLPICGPCVILSLPLFLIMAICGPNSIITLLLFILFFPILGPAMILLSLANIDMMPRRL